MVPRFTVKPIGLSEGVLKLKKQSPEAFKQALKIGALEILRWSANGSENDSSKPPIADGLLRGSGSAFVGSEFVGVVSGQNNKEANKSFTKDDPNQITLGYNVKYAAAMHERDDYTANIDGGRKWLENHINNDKEALYDTIKNQFKKELGKILPEV